MVSQSVKGCYDPALDTVGGVTYTPMSSSEDSYYRLCTMEDRRVLVAGPDTKQHLTEEAFDLAGMVGKGLKEELPIIFFGEYTCTLAYCACMPHAYGAVQK